MKRGSKEFNTYAKCLDPDYEKIPKAALAAIAVSFATCGGDQIEHAHERVVREWWVLFENGIIKRRPTVEKPPIERDSE